jgi:2-keto-4-pentenoate hydratase
MARASAVTDSRSPHPVTADPRVRRGLEAQLARWRALRAQGFARVGWKIGLNDPAVQARLGLRAAVVGHVTLATVIVPGSAHSLAGGTLVGAEPEVAIHLGADVPPGADGARAAAAIVALGPALEVIDVDAPFDDLEGIVAANVFHRAVLFGVSHPRGAGGRLADVTARVVHNGETVATVDAAAVVGDLGETVRLVADLLGACGERLEAGDRILAGSLVRPVWVHPGDVVGLEMEPLGDVELAFTA